ncbi:MAG: hypothetical protein QXJ14_03300 [Candidatus Aenigmatarchaeota archaeon]
MASKQVVSGNNTIIFDNQIPQKTYAIELKCPVFNRINIISYAVNNVDIGGASFDVGSEKILDTLDDFGITKGMIIGTKYNEYYAYTKPITLRLNLNYTPNAGDPSTTALDLYAYVIDEAKPLPYLILTKRETFSLAGSNPTFQLKGILNRRLAFVGSIKSFIVRNTQNLWYGTGNEDVILDFTENNLDRITELQLLVNNDTATQLTIISRIPYVPPDISIQPIVPPVPHIPDPANPL